VPLGGKAFTAAIARAMHVEDQEANRLKEQLGVAVTRAGIDSLSEEQKPVVRALSAPLEELGKEARRSFTYFLTQLSAEPAEASIDKIILCGGGAKLKGLDTFLSGQITAEVTLANVFNSTFVDCSAFDKNYLEDMAPTMVVAMGLALAPFVQSGAYPFSFDVSRCGVVVRAGPESAPGDLG
jgi:type IV pilus assembly protein PilM